MYIQFIYNYYVYKCIFSCICICILYVYEHFLALPQGPPGFPGIPGFTGLKGAAVSDCSISGLTMSYAS